MIPASTISQHSTLKIDHFSHRRFSWDRVKSQFRLYNREFGMKMKLLDFLFTFVTLFSTLTLVYPPKLLTWTCHTCQDHLQINYAYNFKVNCVSWSQCASWSANKIVGNENYSKWPRFCFQILAQNPRSGSLTLVFDARFGTFDFVTVIFEYSKNVNLIVLLGTGKPHRIL